METNSILAAIDQQIMRLQQARALLVTNPASEQRVSRRGRPKGSLNKKVTAAIPKTAKRSLSAEGKARIAAAQKKRWASLKRAAKRATAVTVATKQISKAVAKPAIAKKPAVPAKKRVTAKKLPGVKKPQTETPTTIS